VRVKGIPKQSESISDAKRPQMADQVLPFPKPKMDNEALISGIIAGNPVAASQFHRRYTNDICRLVWCLIGSDTEHEDVVQQVLIQIISSLGTVKKPASLDAWIKSVTLRVVREEIRSRQKHRGLFSRDNAIEADAFPSLHSPFKLVHIRCFYSILNTLSFDDRSILVLRHFEGCSIEEIANIGGYSIATAKRRLKKAKSSFKKKAMKEVVLISLLKDDRDV
jgi:RNA polymerase sigma-70 factor, ECF subfamily